MTLLQVGPTQQCVAQLRKQAYYTEAMHMEQEERKRDLSHICSSNGMTFVPSMFSILHAKLEHINIYYELLEI